MSAPAPAAPLGAPPTLEWVGIDRLAIDAAYQRSTADTASERLIREISQHWDWRLYQPLACARRGDALFVIDGQHRLEAAKRRGDLPHLPCVISNFANPADEALAFAAMNRQRKSMTRLEVYRAAAAGGDPDAVEAVEAIAEAGLVLAPNMTPRSWQPGMIGCVGGVSRAIRIHGRKPTVAALIAISEAYPDSILNQINGVLSGAVRVYAKPPAGFDPDPFIVAISSEDPESLRDQARLFVGGTGDWAAAMERALLRAYEHTPADAELA